MKIINARLRRQEALFTLDLQDGMIHRITAQAAMQTADAGDIDAQGRLAIPPFVEPHIHLDATLTAGEPEWNRSGTLFEGITRWSQRKASITPEDTRQRALKTIGMLRDFGVQHVRTHVDVTDPSLAALKALLAVTCAPMPRTRASSASTSRKRDCGSSISSQWTSTRRP